MQSRESVETEVQSLKAQLLAMQGELEVSRKETAVAKEELRNVEAEVAQQYPLALLQFFPPWANSSAASCRCMLDHLAEFSSYD